ncbi:sulfatase-like hydrolase/transferase [Terriglobus saanensis]|uniref:Sulfatase n=1 Tax=Terriglobus saanensis (strain ATCC BAA-1853 / DSM 23119 / SP1PR4) TaxID=401053 RepID=E8UZ83_TERSS|nr:sulfatase-like hydrolase/transferase [Terriglobus saanensis]ADV82101.1 sulfatase [Terriglobus saanensis SP1PR4]
MTFEFLKKRSFWVSTARYLVAAFLFNLPFVYARHEINMRVAEINLDYLVLVLLYIVAGRFLAGVGFFLVYVVEILKVFDKIYFFTQEDLAYAVRFAFQVQTGTLIGGVSAALLFCALFTYLWLKVLPGRDGVRLGLWAAAPSAVLMVLLLGVDTLKGYNPITRSGGQRWGTHLVGETFYRTSMYIVASLRYDPPPGTPIPSASDVLRPLKGDNRYAKLNIVQVLVESMGLQLNAGEGTREFAMFHSPEILQRYRLTEGSVPFDGPTVPGQLRELCGLQLGVRVDASVAAQSERCLPRQLRSLGYDTEAIHGYTGSMFHRSIWYRDFGFQKSVFLEQMKDTPGMHVCEGAFEGICDADIAQMIHKQLLASRKHPLFVHWMTLNSHLPVEEEGAPEYSCPTGYAEDVCNQLGYVHVALESIAKIAADPTIPPTTFVIVGDHAPPYIEGEKRNLYDQANVPYLLLQPKSASEAAGGSGSLEMPHQKNGVLRP